MTNGKGVAGQLEYFQQLINETLAGIRNDKEVLDVKVKELTIKTDKCLLTV